MFSANALADDPVCTTDAACAGSELCIDGLCRVPECSIENRCPKRSTCASYQCVAISCDLEDRLCPDGQACFQGACHTPVVQRVGSRRDEMVLVPAGHFEMGSEDGVSDERPRHDVEVGGFWLDVFEVSVADVEACIAAGACSQTDTRTNADNPECNLAAEGRSRFPANCVTWALADTYCGWVGKELPTEAQWEYAAAGGDPERTYPWGDQPPRCSRTCRAEPEPGCDTGTSCEIDAHVGDVSPVGARNLGGNVGEWMQDWYATDAYQSGPRLNPRGPATGERRVVRGADYTDKVDPFRVTRRGRLAPGLWSATVGFRCASSL